MIGQVVCNYNPFPTYTYTGYPNYGCTTVLAGETCSSVEARMGWSAGSVITAAGGAINSICSNMPAGARVCGYGYAKTVPVTGTGTTGCVRYTLAYAGQTCDTIASQLGLSTAALLQYNPTITNCGYLNGDQKICF